MRIATKLGTLVYLISISLKSYIGCDNGIAPYFIVMYVVRGAEGAILFSNPVVVCGLEQFDLRKFKGIGVVQMSHRWISDRNKNPN